MARRHTDAGTGRPYCYNPDTGVTTWESPFEAAEGRQPACVPASVGSREPRAGVGPEYWDEGRAAGCSSTTRWPGENGLGGRVRGPTGRKKSRRDAAEPEPQQPEGEGRRGLLEGGTLSGWAGLTFRASDPASGSAQPWGLRGRGLGRGWVELSLRAFDPAPLS